MSKFITTIFIFISLAISQFSHAGLISFDTKSLNGSPLTNDLKASWLSNANQVNSRNIDEFTLIDIGRNRIGHLNINFSIAEQGFWSFDFGLDAGFGAELFVDGNLIVDRTDDLWWARNWQHSDVFSLDTFDFAQGQHNIDVFFAEKCCDGLSTVQFTNHSTQETSILSSNALEAAAFISEPAIAAVPEPATAVLFALGALGLILRRKA